MEMNVNGQPQFFFIPQEDGSWVGEGSEYGQLSVTDGKARYRAPDGTVMQFNRDGTIDYSEDAYGYRFTYNYDAGRLVSIREEDGDTLRIAYNADGLISSMTDPTGDVTTYVYDDAKQLIRIRAPEGDSTFSYNTEQVAAKKHAIVSSSFPNGEKWVSEYDDEGRLIVQGHPDGSDRQTYQYGSAGELVVSNAVGEVFTQTFDGSVRLRQLVDALGRTFRFEYDKKGNPTQTSGPDGTETREYDDHGNLIHYVNTAGQHFYQTHGTNVSPDLLELKDALGRDYQYTRNQAGAPTRTVYPGGNEISDEYNERGQTVRLRNIGRSADHSSIQCLQSVDCGQL